MIWNTSYAVPVNGSGAALDINGPAFRLYGNAGTGGRIDFHTINYGGRESWCSIGRVTGITSRIWNIAVDGANVNTNVIPGVQSLAPPRRQILRATWNGLDVEQVDMLHHKYPFVISLLRVTNTTAVDKAVDAKITMAGTANTHQAGGYFWNNQHFVRLEDEQSFNGYSSTTTATVPAGQTKVFQAVYGGAALTRNGALPFWPEATVLSWAQELDDGAGEAYVNSECDRIDGWYDRVYSQTNLGSQALMDYLPLSVLYTEEQIITQASGRQYTLHGGWADPDLQSGPDSSWYPYPTSTMHQSYPYHYVLLQAGRDDVVADEIKNYALHQDLVTGSQAFHMWPDDVAFPYASTYTEMMFILSIHQYVAFSQDHAFLDEVVNTKTMREHAILAHKRIFDTKKDGLPTGADWHDGWDNTGVAKNSQGSMAYVMALEAMAELDPTNAAAYLTERDDVKAQVVAQMLTTNSGHTFYKRRIDPALSGGVNYFNTWANAILDTSFWAVMAGVGTTEVQHLTMDDLWNGGYVYYGAEGVGVYNGNNNQPEAAMGWLCQNAWSEKFFEYAIADAMLGNTRCIDAFSLPTTVKRRFPEQVAGPGYDIWGEYGTNNSGEPTYSAVALFYKWITEGIFGIKVSLDGTITANPTGVPSDWQDASVAVRIGDSYSLVTADGTVGERFTIADSIDSTVIALPESGSVQLSLVDGELEVGAIAIAIADAIESIVTSLPVSGAEDAPSIAGQMVTVAPETIEFIIAEGIESAVVELPGGAVSENTQVVGVLRITGRRSGRTKSFEIGFDIGYEGGMQ